MGEYDVAILCAEHFQVGLFQNGAGYRYLELALTLREFGVRAAVVCPGPTDFTDCPVPVLDQSTMSPEDIEQCANVFVFCLLEDEKLVTRLKMGGKALIYDSFLTPVEQLTFPRVQAMGDRSRIDAHFHDVVGKHNRFNALADDFIIGEPEEALLKLGELISTFQVGWADYGTLSGRLFPLPVISYSMRHRPSTEAPPATGATFLWNGGLWNHYGGVDLILDAVADMRTDGRDVECHFCIQTSEWPRTG
ncbi:hypothetical protein ACQP00_37805 [Dactylosporangium sp. CS-047395]|uniref:hypothetical protein n=1 Tax=Dactylosporangium sp. CS-047395 TaxID=3239936 RepID=UPI003D89F163